MPILEDMQASLLELHAKIDAMTAGATIPSTAVFTPAPGTNTVTAAEADAALGGSADVELDAAGHFWDGRIHNKAKTKKADNTWKLTRGIDKELVKTVLAEQAATTTTPMPGVVNKPNMPGVVQPAAENGYKKMAIEAINKLTNEMGVEYENIENTLLSKFNVDSFDKLPESAFMDAANEFNGWADDLADIIDLVDEIKGLGGVNADAGLTTINQTRGITKVSEATIRALPELSQALAEFRDQWVAFNNQTA